MCTIFVLLQVVLIRSILYRKQIGTPSQLGQHTEHVHAKCLSVILIVTSLTYIVLVLPYNLLDIWEIVNESKYVIFPDELPEKRNAYDVLLSSIIYSMLYTNSSINFLLYCLSLKRFRNEAVQMLSCGKVKLEMINRTRANTPVTDSTTFDR